MTIIGDKLLALFALGLGILIMLLADLTARFNRGKAGVIFLLGIFYLAVTGYYLYLSFEDVVTLATPPAEDSPPAVSPPAAPPPAASSPAASPAAAPGADFTLIIDINGSRVNAMQDDEIELGKLARLKLVEITGLRTDPTTRANIVGFVANPRRNDGQDIGVSLTYAKLDRRRALDSRKERFKIEIKQGDSVLGLVYLKFVD